ncbi:uncharacterized protein MONBRDRAFT_23172 [Monosiga brevicollis MX1]|uniref:MH2 domain-containing protein n=1 Tax=Monosiga brevicollis TaxID=81824 RepID=A9URE2_MONBE|nr:uncharacterized protein MONBRDRAFT_23172 [Monosiga brevicollis MX1]EDQ91907.1 predicted protein [Monosiga brevicollis MX1]|eukprot:XP_001743193.1 hypothetical protein [Monosiga brevicollis MX1]
MATADLAGPTPPVHQDPDFKSISDDEEEGPAAMAQHLRTRRRLDMRTSSTGGLSEASSLPSSPDADEHGENQEHEHTQDDECSTQTNLEETPANSTLGMVVPCPGDVSIGPPNEDELPTFQDMWVIPGFQRLLCKSVHAQPRRAHRDSDFNENDTTSRGSLSEGSVRKPRNTLLRRLSWKRTKSNYNMKEALKQSEACGSASDSDSTIKPVTKNDKPKRRKSFLRRKKGLDANTAVESAAKKFEEETTTSRRRHLSGSDEAEVTGLSLITYINSLKELESMKAQCFADDCDEQFTSLAELQEHMLTLHVLPRIQQVPDYVYLFHEDLPFFNQRDVVASITYHERDSPLAQFYLNQPIFNISCFRPVEDNTTTVSLSDIDNPCRDSRTEKIRRFIGSGLQVSIRRKCLYVTRLSRNPVFLKNYQSPSTVSDSILLRENGELPDGAEVCLFDYQVFSKEIARMPAELALKMATVSLAFVRTGEFDDKIPCWIRIRMGDALRMWETLTHSTQDHA